MGSFSGWAEKFAAFTRKPSFWVIHTLFCALFVLYAARNFEGAFPFVELDVKMSRSQALKQANDLARDRSWGPAAYRQAVSFDQDSVAQNFIELEAGGPPALSNVLKRELYSLFTWHVRHFSEGKTNETHIRFTPDGRPYGLWQKISEDDPGAALSEAKARAIAEGGAKSWAIDLSQYRLVEHSQEARRSKRVDHWFIYEREKETLGEGRYRLKLGVSGDQLSEVGHFIKTPEGFSRRYSAMRSVNTAIGGISLAAIAILYGFLGCGLGLFLLARSHWVLWKPAALISGLIATLKVFDSINRLPLEWMSYDTAISSQSYLAKVLLNAVLSGCFDFFMLFVPILAGESLTRKAFGHHPQLWKVFSKEAAPTRSILGRTVGAYIACGFHFAYVTWIYRFGATRLGWWNPSEVLFHPDALATYQPWITSVANSLHAGVWEECLFRAIPLAGAAWLGQRFGRKNAWIAIAFVLQAIIFGAAHASYPTQPAYARVLELMVPSFMFGGVYLVFGLLPAILMHYTYDVVLFAMPIFMSSGGLAVLNGAVVIVLSLLPLIWILVSRLRLAQAGWPSLSQSFYNLSWSPAQAAAKRSPAHRPVHVLGLSSRAQALISALAVAGIVIWALAAPWKTDVRGLSLNRAQAVDRAHEVLKERGISLNANWMALASVDGLPDETDSFVWRSLGEQTYHSLVGSYLEPPLWKIRFVRFDGDIADRAEEYQVYLAGAGEVFRFRHELPEARPGKSLDEPEARKIAADWIRSAYGLEAASLKEVVSNQFLQPARRDWIFAWSNPAVDLQGKGEVRAGVRVYGDEVTSYRRYVEIPDEWKRQERNRRATMEVIGSVTSFGVLLLILALTVDAFIAWIKGDFRMGAFLVSALAIFVLDLVANFNRFPSVLASFSTAKSLLNQELTHWIKVLVKSVAMAAIPAMWIGVLQVRFARTLEALPLNERPVGRRFALGLGIGAIVEAAKACAQLLNRRWEPNWPAFGSASDYFVPLSALGSVSTFMIVCAGAGLVFWNLHYRLRKPWMRVGACILLALMVSSSRASVDTWLVSSLVTSVLLISVSAFLRRVGDEMVLPIVAASAVLGAVLMIATQAHPSSTLQAVLTLAGVVGVSWFWFKSLKGRGRVQPSPFSFQDLH